ncbi:MAG: DUF922 domain-containing protein [Magnetococcales bacterium]|nr:DUF922 domain-containing protein [Magnetococcales bacterium]MBF0151167.1 DUF922 domain-containing protein [Magnetococcales bacterium]MBF0632649.1 DUF922 domain-containing protein [Magnetococcales bacterium]
MRRWILLPLLLAFASGCSLFEDKKTAIDDDDPRLKDIEHIPPAIPAPLASFIERKEVSYDIQGRSVAELNEAMQKASPCIASILHHENEKSVACTQSRFTLAHNDAPPNRVQGLCRTEQFRLRLRITITLPEWTNALDGHFGVADAWEFFHRALTRHEEGHANIAISEFIKFDQEVTQALAQRPDSTCERKQRLFTKVWQRSYRKVKQRNQEYDRRTANGVNNGTSFY